MFTAKSKLVSPELKRKIMIHIAAIRIHVGCEQSEKNEYFIPGIRFNSDEEVFQTFCMANIKVGQSDINLEQLPELCENALIDAGECDYYYSQEKEF